MSMAANIKRELKKLGLKLVALDRKQSEIIREKNALIVQIDSLQKALKALDEKAVVAIPATAAELELFFALNENSQLGDAIEMILEVRGPLRRKEIIEWLRRYRVRISRKAPEQVLANAIKKDKKQRFVILEDGRVTVKK